MLLDGEAAAYVHASLIPLSLTFPKVDALLRVLGRLARARRGKDLDRAGAGCDRFGTRVDEAEEDDARDGDAKDERA